LLSVPVDELVEAELLSLVIVDLLQLDTKKDQNNY
jgi:hypothetical protein